MYLLVYFLLKIYIIHFRGRKMNASLEKAIQEAMVELDRMAEID